MTRSSLGVGLAALAAIGILLSPVAGRAQNVSVVRSGTFELGGFVGASYGVDDFRVMGGGNISYAANKYILPYAEYSYFPGIGREQTGTFPTTGRTYKLTYSIPLSDFHGGVHIRIPVLREKPVVPYLVIGVGGLTNGSRKVKARYTDATGQPAEQEIDVRGTTEFAVNGGGGLRFYIGQKWGLRAEAKVYKPSGDFGSTFGKVEAGIFYQFQTR